MKTFAFPGSFDPFHEGHLWVVESCIHLGFAAYDNPMYIVVANNASKNYKSTLDERVALIKSKLSDSFYDCVKVIGCSDDDIGGSLTQHNVNIIVRGLRDANDFEYESAMTKHARSEWMMEVVYLPCPEALSNVSSTKIRTALK